MISISENIILLTCIISLILEVWTASSAEGSCDSQSVLKHKYSQLECDFAKDTHYDQDHLAKCKCKGSECYTTLPHANLLCGSDSNWYLANNDETSVFWGVECGYENSCPRCFIPKADFSKCYKRNDYASEYVCVCNHNKIKYILECHYNTLYEWSTKAHEKCEKSPQLIPNNNISTNETTNAAIISTSSTTLQSQMVQKNVSEPNQKISTAHPAENKTYNYIFTNETSTAPSTLSTTQYRATTKGRKNEPDQTTSTPPPNVKKEWFEETITYIILGSIVALIAFCAIAFAIFVMIKRRRPARPIIL
ncbi:uncharacterized protein LOC132204420 isoform X2 [Neocloeon triangulifer]|uniref:uncharacterized protein LOC132204420 isoform X2 n=1 Tax=Neocloeon triangulifer TaxID=2078957 RepID=UPI00286EE9A2|nr:uncharacterized protein LOC132204420 isoform X2 [Neocloeon triangulifer]